MLSKGLQEVPILVLKLILIEIIKGPSIKYIVKQSIDVLACDENFDGGIPFQIPKFWSAIKDETSALLKTAKSSL